MFKRAVALLLEEYYNSGDLNEAAVSLQVGGVDVLHLACWSCGRQPLLLLRACLPHHCSTVQQMVQSSFPPSSFYYYRSSTTPSLGTTSLKRPLITFHLV